jgi:hypothetical protein
MALLKSFLGLSNFFRGHIRNYAELAEPLIKLAKTNSGYKGGPLPTDAAIAFKRLKNTLASEPVLSFPRRDQQFAVIVDASMGTADCPGGIGAILAQMDHLGKFYAFCYASRQLWPNEKSHSPYLLEMAAADWAIKTFADHLRGQRFILFTDHRPLQKVAMAPAKILNGFQMLGLEFDFVTQYKKGINMPADFLSQADATLANEEAAQVHLVELLPRDMMEEQHRYDDIAALKQYRSTGQFPAHVLPLIKY